MFRSNKISSKKQVTRYQFDTVIRMRARRGFRGSYYLGARVLPMWHWQGQSEVWHRVESPCLLRIQPVRLDSKARQAKRLVNQERERWESGELNGLTQGKPMVNKPLNVSRGLCLRGGKLSSHCYINGVYLQCWILTINLNLKSMKFGEETVFPFSKAHVGGIYMLNFMGVRVYPPIQERLECKSWKSIHHPPGGCNCRFPVSSEKRGPSWLFRVLRGWHFVPSYVVIIS